MRSVLLALVAALLLLPAGAAAQFGPLPPAPPPPTEPAPGAPGAQAEEGFSDLEQLLVVLAGVALVLAIGFGIARDAKKNAPVAGRDERGPRLEPGETAGERKKLDARAAQKQKAAAKRARQARKKNRPVRK